MDAVQKANSGHPGTPMALAPVAYVFWNDHLNYDPAHPHWVARDRFVLSCGHASMLLYSVLHLAGVAKIDASGNPTSEPAISLADIENFRQLHSPCAGHPEFGYADGIETTTGPLGQGLGNSVGMAIAAKWLAATYDRPNFDLFGFNTYAIVQRWRRHGGRRVRGRFSGGTPEAFKSLLDLRRQSDHDRGSHRIGV